MLCGALFGSEGAGTERRAEVYAQVQAVRRKFCETFGTDQCAELLGIPARACEPQPEARTQAYYDRRPCLRIVTESCGLMEKMLEESWGNGRCAH